jgi:hypothetical protein
MTLYLVAGAGAATGAVAPLVPPGIRRRRSDSQSVRAAETVARPQRGLTPARASTAASGHIAVDAIGLLLDAAEGGVCPSRPTFPS